MNPVAVWLTEVDGALGRLFVSGLAHPPLDLPPTLTLLAERAEVVGVPTAAQKLSALAALLEGLCPGPPQRDLRTERAERAFKEGMELVAWLRLFRGHFDLQRAGTLQQAEAEADDVPRFTGRMRIDGAHLEGDRLVIAGRDEEEQPLFAVDILADLDRDDPFGSPVISRLLQRSIELSELLDATLEFEAHPVGRARRGRMLKPAFRSAPVLRPAEARPPQDEELEVRWSDGVRTSDRDLFVPPLLDFNLTKLLAHQQRPRLAVLIQRGRTGHRLIRADDGNGACLPALDARCWTVPAPVLARWVEDADPWVRTAASLYGPRLQPCEGWRGAWAASRRGGKLAASPPIEGEGLALYSGVWHRHLRDEPLREALLDGKLSAEAVRDDAFATCARALVLHRFQPEQGLDYLHAHLETVDADDETLVWLVFAETRARMGEPLTLDLPVQPQRLRWARTVRAFRAGEPAEGLGDVLAWGAVATWRATVVG